MRYLRSGVPVLGLAFVLLLLSSCGGDSPTTPPAPVAGSLTATAGDAQTGAVGAALGTGLSAVVKDTDGAPMAGVAVAWAVTAGGGSVSQASTTSGSDGSVSVTWTLGGSAGAQSVTATAAGFSVTYSATAQVGPAAQVVVTAASTTLEALEATVQLAASATDQFGNPVTGAGDVTWASGDTTVVAVRTDGTATAVANGAADVTATMGSLSGTTTLTVAQKATAVAVSPENPVTSIGGTVQLSAAGEDANGFAVAGGAFTWTSSDAAVATVDSTGLVTGVAEGTATVTATSGSVSGTATLTVTAAPFNPTEDTEISGTLNVAEVTVPAGVTVTLTADAVINAAGNITIAGAVTGDCVEASVMAGGDLTMSGAFTTTCADSTQSGGDLTVQAAGALTLDGGSLNSGGGVFVSNVAATGVSGAVRGPSMVDEAAQPCLVRDVAMNVGSSGRGAPGTPGGSIGGDGGAGKAVEIRCAGNLTIEGVSMKPGWGGNGGRATSTTSEPALGGHGGAAGDVIITAGGNIIFGISGKGTKVKMNLGPGGGGGYARAQGATPTAVGGDGGRFGLPFVEAGGSILFREPEALVIEFLAFFSGGGEAEAIGEDGEDATSSAAAKPAGMVEATGGTGHTIGLVGQQTDLIGTHFKGEVINPLFLYVPAPWQLGRRGGRAAGLPGNGGRGSEEFPDGAKGGSALLTGGQGGPVNLWDNRWNQFVAAGGEGGDILFGAFLSEVTVLGEGDELFTPEGFPEDHTHAQGGLGWSDCRVGALKEGGLGGAGGDASGIVGQPGGTGGAVGGVVYRNYGNGADAGSGPNEPKGGAAGNADQVIGLPDETTNSFQAGADGSGCAIIMEPGVSVTSDANGHAPFIALGPSQLTVTLGTGNAITISGNGNWVTVTGTVDASGAFTATGSGTVAGFSGVPVSFDGVLSLDEEGRATGIQSGTLTMDSTNSNLPPNGGGQRNAAVYSVTATNIG